MTKIIAQFLEENFRFETRHNIRNNLELIEGSKKLKIKSNDKLISFDVNNMFGKISKEPLLELLRSNSFYRLPEGLKYAYIVGEIIDQNYCLFNNRFQKLPKGFAMGSPIGSS